MLIRSTHSIGSVILIALWAKREIVTSVNQSGHHSVRRSHIELLSTLERGGVRMSDIARELGVTRQAVSATVRELEGLCYVERRPDSTDRRAVLIAPSVEGSELLDKVVGAAQRVRGAAAWTRWVTGAGAASPAIWRSWPQRFRPNSATSHHRPSSVPSDPISRRISRRWPRGSAPSSGRVKRLGWVRFSGPGRHVRPRAGRTPRQRRSGTDEADHVARS